MKGQCQRFPVACLLVPTAASPRLRTRRGLTKSRAVRQVSPTWEMCGSVETPRLPTESTGSRGLARGRQGSVPFLVLFLVLGSREKREGSGNDCGGEARRTMADCGTFLVRRAGRDRSMSRTSSGRARGSRGANRGKPPGRSHRGCASGKRDGRVGEARRPGARTSPPGQPAAAASTRVFPAQGTHENRSHNRMCEDERTPRTEPLLPRARRPSRLPISRSRAREVVFSEARTAWERSGPRHIRCTGWTRPTDAGAPDAGGCLAVRTGCPAFGRERVRGVRTGPGRRRRAGRRAGPGTVGTAGARTRW